MLGDATTAVLEASLEFVMTPKLLIVEDDNDILHLLAAYFQPEYQVVTVHKGEEALERLKSETFDLLLLDIGLPGIDGFEVLRQVRAHFTQSDLPVILLSGTDRSDAIIKGLNAGANDYVVKPPQPEVLQARARTLLDLKRLDDMHKQMIRDLTQAQQTQEKFLRIVSHDLKNPLNNIRTALFLLRDMVRDHDTANQILDRADTTINEMISMIMTFLDVSRLQSGAPMEVNLNVVNLSDVIRHLIGQNRATAETKGITLRADDITGLALADARLFTQALGNLIDNAIKFSPFDSTVRIGIEPVGRDGDWLRVCVTDQGPGVPADERNRLFEMFSKLSPRPTASEGSTGLGLWIVKHLTAMQGGRTGADFPADGGSIFWIEIPTFRP